MVKPIVIKVTRDEIIAKINEPVDVFAADDEEYLDFEYEPSIIDEAKEILTKIAGTSEDSMLSDEETASLLHIRDIYHFQADAVRLVRQFLSA